MNSRTAVLLGLVGLLVIALFLLSVELGSGGGRADPEDAGGLETVGDALGGLPGLGTDLEADAVDADCFDGRRFAVTLTPCVFTVAGGVDRIRLGLVAGPCRIVVAQGDAVPQRLDSSRHFRRGRVDVRLTGEPATVSISAPTPAGCVLQLETG